MASGKSGLKFYFYKITSLSRILRFEYTARAANGGDSGECGKYGMSRSGGNGENGGNGEKGGNGGKGRKGVKSDNGGLLITL